MADKVKKIREEVEKRYECWKEKESNSHSIESEIRMSECQHLLLMLNSLQEEHVSEDLEEASKEWLIPQLNKSYAAYGETKQMELTHFDGYAMLDAVEFGANWQKQQDQSTIELAEDHAMLAGMEKMKEGMMAKAIDGEVITTSDYGWENIRVHKKEHHCGQKVKVIVIKED